MQSIARRAGSTPLLRRSTLVASASAARRLLHSNSSWRLSADKKPAAAAAASTPSATSAAIAAAVPHSAHKTVGNSAADLRRIFREQQRASLVSQEAFPWEITQQKVTAWEPKYEDEKKFYYASKVQEGTHNLQGDNLRRYLDGYGSRYLLSKHALKSGAELPSVRMTSPGQLQVELLAASSVLNYWFMNLTASQRPINTVKAQLESARVKSKEKQVLKVRLSQQNLYNYLVSLHELWPRKDERDIEWKTLPRREHGQYRVSLQRVLAEGASKPLNKATQSFIDYLTYQVAFHFKEAKKQNRNLHWLQFLGIPGVKVNKKWGGEIKVPKLRSRED